MSSPVPRCPRGRPAPMLHSTLVRGAGTLTVSGSFHSFWKQTTGYLLYKMVMQTLGPSSPPTLVQLINVERTDLSLLNVGRCVHVFGPPAARLCRSVTSCPVLVSLAGPILFDMITPQDVTATYTLSALSWSLLTNSVTIPIANRR